MKTGVGTLPSRSEAESARALGERLGNRSGILEMLAFERAQPRQQIFRCAIASSNAGQFAARSRKFGAFEIVFDFRWIVGHEYCFRRNERFDSTKPP